MQLTLSNPATNSTIILLIIISTICIQPLHGVLLKSCEENEIGKSWYEATSQAFVVFLPVKSVGVMGDGRSYEWTVVLRCVKTSDFMTASWSRLPYKLIEEVSNKIINEIPGINRVAYDVSSKPPSTIEWE